MSVFVFNGVGTPNTPATGKTCVYVDSSDGRLKSKDSTGTISILQANGFDDKNILVNGGFDINQRVADSNTAVSGASATARVYVADRWTITTSNVTTPQFQRVDTIAAIETGITARFYGKFTQITNGAKHLYAQAVPGDTLTQLRGRTVRFQLKAKSFAGSNRTMRLGLIQLNSAGTTDTLPATFVSAFNGASVDPTLGTNLAYITPSVVDNGTVVGSAMNFTLTGSWARYSATFTVPSNCVNLVVALWNDSTGAAADSIGITECGLYDGAEIRDWLPFPQESVLARAQHFYAKSFPQGTAPAQNAGVNGSVCGIIGKAGATALAVHIPIRFPVTMHKTPATPTLYSPSSAAAQPFRIDGTSPAVQTAGAIIQTSDQGFVVTATGDASGAVGDLVGVHYSADADI
jgi:hypothetical protein